MRIDRFLKQFNWRFLLVRILVNALALAVTAAVTPKIYFEDKSVWSWLLMAVMLGILNALLKPLLQFLTLQFIFVTYGLVVVLVNAFILLLLSVLFSTRFKVDNLWWALVGGLVLGLFSSFLESLLGLTMPIVPEEAVVLRRQLAEEARHAGRLASARREAGPEDQALTLAPPVAKAKAPVPGVAEPAGAEPVAAESAAAESAAVESAAVESAAPAPDERPPLPAPVETEPSDSVVAPLAEADAPGEATAPADADTPESPGVAEDREPVPQDEQEEGGS